jgi:hypothetical protein
VRELQSHRAGCSGRRIMSCVYSLDGHQLNPLEAERMLMMASENAAWSRSGRATHPSNGSRESCPGPLNGSSGCDEELATHVESHDS